MAGQGRSAASPASPSAGSSSTSRRGPTSSTRPTACTLPNSLDFAGVPATVDRDRRRPPPRRREVPRHAPRLRRARELSGPRPRRPGACSIEHDLLTPATLAHSDRRTSGHERDGVDPPAHASRSARVLARPLRALAAEHDLDAHVLRRSAGRSSTGSGPRCSRPEET